MNYAERRRTWIKSRRQKRKAARHARIRRQVFRGALLLFVMVLGTMGFCQLPWSLTDIDNDIVVRGNLYTPTEQIKKRLSTSCLYVPVYRLDPARIEKSLEEFAPVKRAYVRRYGLPHPRLVVDVVEEFPWASLTSSPEAKPHAVIAESGRLIPVAKFPNFPRPALTICGSKALSMESDDVKQWGTWIGYIEAQTSETVSNLDIRRPYDVRVKTTSTQLRLGVPDTTLTHRLGRLASIMPEVKKYGDQIEYVDLALDNNVPLKLSKEKVQEARRKGPRVL